MNDKKIELISAKGAMGVTEFALLYFPESPPETAYKRMWVWIRTSRGLKEKLLTYLSYNDRSKLQDGEEGDGEKKAAKKSGGKRKKK